MQRYLFDLDGTIMDADYSYEDIFFKDKLSKEDFERFNSMKSRLVEEYERTFTNYDIDLFSKFLTKKSGVYISNDLVKEWIDVGSNFNDKLVDGIIPLLEYLKSHNKEIVLLSNWFLKTQKDRLKKQGLIDYFDELYGGEIIMKPYRGAFIKGAGKEKISNCVMIGDNYSKDVLGARRIGMKGIYYSPKESSIEDKYKVKKLIDIKEMF